VISTLIIPTYNRSGFLRRCIRYLASQNTAHSVLIADGSSGDHLTANQRLVDEYAGMLDLRHEVYPSELPFLARCHDVLRLVRTETATFHADDDFLLGDAIGAAAEELLARPELAAVQGPTVIVQPSANPRLARIHTSHTFACEQAKASDRLKAWMGNYRPLFYATSRTSVLSHAFGEISRMEPPAPRLVEIALCYFVLVQGGIGVLPGLFGVRESHSQSTGRSDMNWTDIACADWLSPWLSRFRTRLTDFTTEAGLLSEDEDLPQAINQSYTKFLGLAFGAPRPINPAERFQRAFSHEVFMPGDVHDSYRAVLSDIFGLLESAATV
jgi:glycosyltransferase domain-containing protein